MILSINQSINHTNTIIILISVNQSINQWTKCNNIYLLLRKPQHSIFPRKCHYIGHFQRELYAPIKILPVYQNITLKRRGPDGHRTFTTQHLPPRPTFPPPPRGPPRSPPRPPRSPRGAATSTRRALSSNICSKKDAWNCQMVISESDTFKNDVCSPYRSVVGYPFDQWIAVGKFDERVA